MALREYLVRLPSPLTKEQLAAVIEGIVGPAGPVTSETAVLLRFGHRSYEDVIDYDVWIGVKQDQVLVSFRAGSREQINAIQDGLAEGIKRAGLNLPIEEDP